MKLDDIKNQLGSKQRSEADLFRFIKTRTDNTPNYTLLLGAGCSVSSGIRPATALCNVWRNEIISNTNPELLEQDIDQQRDWLKRYEGSWYDPQREYSTLFEKNMTFSGKEECSLRMKSKTQPPPSATHTLQH